MNRREKEEIRDLPEKYKPIGAWGYVGYSILYSIPFLGWLFLLVFAFSGGNIARRSFARSYFAKLLLVLICVAIIVVIAIVFFGPVLKEYFQMIQEMMGQMGSMS